MADLEAEKKELEQEVATHVPAAQRTPKKRGRPRKASAPQPFRAKPEQLPEDAIVDETGDFDQAAADKEKLRLAQMVSWTMPKTPTGDPVRIMNEKRTWELWPQTRYRTPLGVMQTALAQAGVNAQIEQERFIDRGTDVYLGQFGGPGE